jgi:hypothetical protein
MSGSVSPGSGTLIAVFFVLAILLGIGYLVVILKLVLYDSHSVALRIILGAITPGLIIISLRVSNLTNNKTINIATVVLLTLFNLIYLLTPVTTHLSTLIYNGNNEIITTILMGVISISTSLLIVIGLAGLTFGILRILKL